MEQGFHGFFYIKSPCNPLKSVYSVDPYVPCGNKIMNDNPNTTPEQNNTFSLIVAALLVVILVALAGLWIIERRQRGRAENDLMLLQAEGQKKMQTMGNMLVQQMTQKQVAVNREQLPTQQVDFNGRARTILLLSAADGEKLGFQPGDVIFVTQPATSQPTTQPTPQSQ